MKTRVSFLLIFLSLFLLTPLAISGKFADQKSNGTFSFDGSTTSTSGGHGGHRTTFYFLSGSASISGNAIELGQDTVYKGELWLMVSGDIVSSPFPGKDNIDTTKHDGIAETFTKGDASILYLSHPVSSIAKGEVNIYNSQVVRELSESLSESYFNGSFSSPTGLCASPEFHGALSGTLMNHSGSKSPPLARIVPSIEKDREGTPLSCPTGVLKCSPVCAFHSRISPSQLPLAKVCPSGLKATQ